MLATYLVTLPEAGSTEVNYPILNQTLHCMLRMQSLYRTKNEEKMNNTANRGHIHYDWNGGLVPWSWTCNFARPTVDIYTTMMHLMAHICSISSWIYQ